MLNQLVVVGRLVSDPEIIVGENNKKRTYITVAVPRSYKNIDTYKPFNQNKNNVKKRDDIIDSNENNKSIKENPNNYNSNKNGNKKNNYIFNSNIQNLNNDDGEDKFV